MFFEMKYATALYPSCAEESDVLKKRVIVKEEFGTTYKQLYKDQKQATDTLLLANTKWREAHDQCVSDNTNCVRRVDELELSLGRSRTENWIWRGLAIIGVAIVIIN